MKKVTKKDLLARIEALENENKQRGIGTDVEIEPKLKQLDQSVFDGLDEKWRFAAVCGSGKAIAAKDRPETLTFGYFVEDGYLLIGTGYDTTNWQNSLIERDLAKELLEIDLSSELTGSDYYYSKSVTERLENGRELIMCFVSNVSESDAIQERHVEVITSVDTEFNDTDGYGWQYAVPINNQGEPLTASEVRL